MARALEVIEGGQPRNASEALAEQQQEFLECRDLRHPWRVVGLFYVGREIHRKLVCQRCETEAVDVWSAKGARITRRYKYPEGFKIEGLGKRRVKPVDVRREVMNRVEIYQSEEEMVGALFRGRARKKA